MSSVMSVIDFVAIMPYYIGLGLDDDNEVQCHFLPCYSARQFCHLVIQLCVGWITVALMW